MTPLTLDIGNVSKAKEYLSSIGRQQEFNDKNIDAAHWYAVIQFANRCLADENNKKQ